MNTHWNSWATPIATTAGAVALSRYGRIRSIRRSPFLNRTTGMSLTSAKSDTARRNAVPILLNIAGDGTGNPRCSFMNAHDLPADLQARHIAVEVDPIETLQIERDMTVEQIVHVHHAGHRPPPNEARLGPNRNHRES